MLALFSKNILLFLILFALYSYILSSCGTSLQGPYQISGASNNPSLSVRTKFRSTQLQNIFLPSTKAKISRHRKTTTLMIPLTCGNQRIQTHRNRTDKVVSRGKKWGAEEMGDCEKVQAFSYQVNKFWDVKYSILTC